MLKNDVMEYSNDNCINLRPWINENVSSYNLWTSENIRRTKDSVYCIATYLQKLSYKISLWWLYKHRDHFVKKAIHIFYTFWCLLETFLYAHFFIASKRNPISSERAINSHSHLLLAYSKGRKGFYILQKNGIKDKVNE